MISLTLITLLNSMSGDFCRYKASGMDTVKAVLLSYSHAHDRYGSAAVQRVVRNSVGLEAAAIAAVVAKCPSSI